MNAMQSGMRALVTGASSGIGEAVVRQLCAAGYSVTAIARRAERLQTLAAETGATPLALDLTDTAHLYELLSKEHFDVLVNNAGVVVASAAFSKRHRRTSTARYGRTLRPRCTWRAQCCLEWSPAA